MSEYHKSREFYNQTAHFYPSYREPIGIDFITGMITVFANQPREKIRILDAGCGPGSHAKSLIKFGFRRITLLDQSHAMLKQARRNLSEEIRNNYIEEIAEETLPVIPFADNSFDVVMFNLVLHHLKISTNNEILPAIIETLHEAHRVLRPNGMIVITTILPSVFH